MFRQSCSSVLWMCTAWGSFLYSVHFLSPFPMATAARSLHCISGACTATQNCHSTPSVCCSVLQPSRDHLGKPSQPFSSCAGGTVSHVTVQMAVCRLGKKKKQKTPKRNNHNLFPKGKKKGVGYKFFHQGSALFPWKLLTFHL